MTGRVSRLSRVAKLILLLLVIMLLFFIYFRRLYIRLNLEKKSGVKNEHIINQK